MKKYKPKLVKFVFTPKQHRGQDWKTAPNPDYRFGNRYTDDTHQYNWHRHNIATLFSDELEDDPRQFDPKAKFTINEAHILLLQYLEDNLKRARTQKRHLDRLEEKLNNYPKLPDDLTLIGVGHEYARNVNNRELAHNLAAVKKYRKIVKQIKNSPEYIWEQLLK